MMIRRATDDDAGAIAELLNADLATSTTEWNDVPHSVEGAMRWIGEHETVLVAEDGGAVVGFVAYGWFRDAVKRPGYRFTVETSVRIAASHRRTGIGRQLMVALVEDAKATQKHRMVACIDSGNDRAIRFHESLGFVEVGRMPEIGTKLGQWLDLVLMTLALDERPPPP